MTTIPAATMRHERREQARLHDLAQDHHLGQREGRDGHHEREGGAHRQALAEERLDDRDRARGVGVERHAEGDERRHRERVARAADLDDELGGHEAVDDGADADADDHVGPDPPDDVERGAPGVAQAVAQGGLAVDRDAPGADLPDVVLDVALELEPADQQSRRRPRR